MLMRVYVETNFVLELAFQQEQHAACEAILSLAEARDIHLVLPVYSVEEASATLQRKAGERKTLMDANIRELREVARMQGYEESVTNTRGALTELLVDNVQRARNRLEHLTRRLRGGGEILPLTSAASEKATELRTTYGLSQPDSLVLASILGDRQLGHTESCFLNRNSKDFDDARIHHLLAQSSCRLITNFKDGHQYIQAKRIPGG
jgi:predicted nucleic acid-binding protein